MGARSRKFPGEDLGTWRRAAAAAAAVAQVAARETALALGESGRKKDREKRRAETHGGGVRRSSWNQIVEAL